jgi:hypothetical protein
MDLKPLIGQIVCVQAKGCMVTGELKCVGGQYRVERVFEVDRYSRAELFLCFWSDNVSEVVGNVIELN